MSGLFSEIQELIYKGEIKVSSHGYDELAEDHIFLKDILATIQNGRVIEEYPNFGKGPCALVLQLDRDLRPIHTVWGIPKGYKSPAVLITAYRPDPARWTDDFMRRMIS
jgi:hypothetical protein